jgi:general secretion pathway protein M
MPLIHERALNCACSITEGTNMGMLERYRELSLRDQAMLILLALTVLFYLVYQLGWRPLITANHDLAERNADLGRSVQEMSALAAEWRQLSESAAPGGTASTESLAQLLDRAAAAQKLSMSRFQPGSSGDVQIRFDNCAFENILRWLDLLEGEGVSVRDLSVSRGSAPGLVNVSVRLFRA